jgi:hypothetical protein
MNAVSRKRWALRFMTTRSRMAVHPDHILEEQFDGEHCAKGK